MKKLLVNKISNNSDIEKICLMFDEYRIVTFDIFDTLVKRNVYSPVDVFQLIEKQYNREHTIKIKGFASERAAAEQKARRDSKYEEITLDEIYNKLSYDARVCSELKKIELNTELNICSPNTVMLDIYNKLLDKGKIVYLISDMYLPQKAILTICSKCNIANFKKVYVSSEHRCRKKGGRLFAKFIASEAIDDIDHVIHIGDSFYADYISARIAGINACMISRSSKKTDYVIENCEGDDFSQKTINAFISNHIDPKNNYFYNMGYIIYGLLLYSFTRWILENIGAEGTDKVLFLARDSYILQKAFVALSENRYDNDYFYVSRKSTFGMRLTEDYSVKNIVSKAHLRQGFLLEDLLKRIGAYTEKNVTLANNMDVNLNMPITLESVDKNEILNKYLYAVCLELKQRFLEEAKMFEAYTMQFIKKDRKISVVDVGWNGTAQKAIDTVLRKNRLDIEIEGYYLAVNKEDNGREKDIAVKGFLSNEDSTETQRIKIKAIMGLLEFFLSAPHGTTKGYCKKDYKVFPQLEIYEYQDKKYVQNAFSNLQEGALKFVKDFGNWEFTDKIQITPEMAMQPLLSLCRSAKRKDLKKFGDLLFYEGVLSPLAKPKRIYEYLFCVSQLKRDFGNSVWKVGFLKRLCHSIPLPYYQLYSILIRRYKK